MSKTKDELDNLQKIEDAIQHSKDSKAAGDLVKELRSSNAQLQSTRSRLVELNLGLDMTREAFHQLKSTIHDELRPYRNGVGINIAPEETQRIRSIFNDFVKDFESSLAKKSEQIVSDFNKEMTAAAKKGEKVTDALNDMKVVCISHQLLLLLIVNFGLLLSYFVLSACVDFGIINFDEPFIKVTKCFVGLFAIVNIGALIFWFYDRKDKRKK